MIITDLIQKSETNYAIYIDGHYLTIVHEEILHKNNLKKGSVITPEIYDKIFDDASFRKARERALHLLYERSYTCKELFEKVNKTNDEKVTQAVIEFLKQNKLLNDKKYTQSYAYEASQYKKWGKQKIIFNLKQKGVDIFEIEDALQNFEFNGKKEVEFLIQTKFKDKIYDRNGIKKVFDSLYKMGYSKDDILPVLNPYKEQISQINQEIPQNEKIDEIKKIISLKYARKLETPNGGQKVFASLARKGYPFELVKKALEEYITEQLNNIE